MNYSDFYTQLNKYLLFLFLTICSIFFIVILQEIIITDEVYYNHFNEILPAEKITEIFQFKEKWWWLNYVIIPLIYLLKFTFLSLWLLTATVFMGYKVSYRKLFQAAMLAEFVMFIPSLMKVVWFGLIQTDFSLTDLQLFNPLSLIGFVNIDTIEPWLIYPIQTISILEILYVIILGYGIKIAINQDYNTALKFTLPVYFSGLLVWIIFVTFLTINLTT